MYQAIELSAGTIQYKTFGADTGEPVLFVHGFAVDGRIWEPVAHRLADAGLRCIVPTWPLGSHQTAMKREADLTPLGVANMVRELLDALDLDRVTLVGNDSGGAVSQFVVTQDASRIARLVLTNCDSFENYPPGVFKLIARLVRRPAIAYVMAQSMRFRTVLRGPFGYRALSARALPLELVRSFVAPLIADAGVRRDAMRFFGGADTRDTLAAATKLPDLTVPALIVWGADDTLFPVSDAHRLQRTLPDSSLVLVPNAKVLVALDQPEAVADAINSFVTARPVTTDH